MSQYKSNNKSNGKQTGGLETNYEKCIVAGIKYETQEEAIIESALAMTRREKTSALALVKELGGDFTEKDIVQALYNTKKNFIIESIKHRAESTSIEAEIKL